MLAPLRAQEQQAVSFPYEAGEDEDDDDGPGPLWRQLATRREEMMAELASAEMGLEEAKGELEQWKTVKEEEEKKKQDAEGAGQLYDDDGDLGDVEEKLTTAARAASAAQARDHAADPPHARACRTCACTFVAPVRVRMPMRWVHAPRCTCSIVPSPWRARP